MGSGMDLKLSLGLEDFENAKISRVLTSSKKILVVYYDSFRPQIPITNARVRKNHRVATVWNGAALADGENKHTIMTPLLDLEDYNGSTKNALIIPIDLAGDNRIDKRKFSRVFENEEEGYMTYLNLKEFTVSDLRANAATTHDKEFAVQRRADGITGSFLNSVRWNKATNLLTALFKVKPTFGASQGNFTKNGTPKRGKNYTVKLQFENVESFLGKRIDFLDLSKGEQIKKVRRMIKEANVRVWSDDPSWLLQGHFENAFELGYSVFAFPTSIPKAEGRWAEIKTGSVSTPYFSLSKHVQEVLRVVGFNADTLAKEIREG